MPQAPLGFDLPDSGATEDLGRGTRPRLFPAPHSGAILHLRGELGSGKTTCARSLLHALGVTAPVRSPTYTLVDTYSVGDLDLRARRSVSGAEPQARSRSWDCAI